MKKSTKELQSKSIKELEKTGVSLHEEIAKSRLQEKVSPGKDTNAIHKKKKHLAVILTVISQKKELEALQKSK